MMIFSLKSYAAEVLTHEGVVEQVTAMPQSYGAYSVDVKGLLAIYVEGLPKGCTTGQNRVVISSDHPLHNSVLSMALLAKSTGKKVRIAYFNECTIRAQSWDLAYFHVFE